MIKIIQPVYNRMIAHARDEAPSECCGLLAGPADCITGIDPMHNLSSDHPLVRDLNVPADRSLRYVMDPKEQFQVVKRIRASGLTLMGIYHSHPHSAAFPSETDVRLALAADVFYIIISLAGIEANVRAFTIVDRKITE